MTAMENNVRVWDLFCDSTDLKNALSGITTGVKHSEGPFLF